MSPQVRVSVMVTMSLGYNRRDEINSKTGRVDSGIGEVS